MRAHERHRIRLEEAGDAAEHGVQYETVSLNPGQGDAFQMSLRVMRRQNSCSRGSRFSGSLPAISPALMAPMDVPMIQSGSRPASCSA